MTVLSQEDRLRLERVHDLLTRARLARPAMVEPLTPGPVRDAATDAYVRAVDEMVAELAELADSGAIATLARGGGDAGL